MLHPWAESSCSYSLQRNSGLKPATGGINPTEMLRRSLLIEGKCCLKPRETSLQVLQRQAIVFRQFSVHDMDGSGAHV